MSLCIILLKAWLLPVTVGEHVACGRHNFNSTVSHASRGGKKKVVLKLEITGSESEQLFVCVFAFMLLCACAALCHTALFVCGIVLFADPSVSEVATGLHESLC